MSSRWALLTSIAIGLAGVPLITTTVHAQEKVHEGEVTMDQLPKPARDKIMQEAGTDKIEKIEQKNEKGGVVFDAKVKKEKGGTYDIKVDSAGKLLKKD
jgi:hypothetical protein